MQTPIEQRLTISLPHLKKRGYFDHRRAGRLAWWHGGQLRDSVDILIGFDLACPEDGGRLTIDYEQHGQPVREVIAMEHVRSNLGRGGGIWYFVCPQTGKRCRTLISGRSGFASRHAESGLRYQSQLWSHQQRTSSSGQRALRQKERALESVKWLINPHSKRSYAGRLTRPMLRFRKLNDLDGLTE